MTVELEMTNEENGRLRRHIKTLEAELTKQEAENETLRGDGDIIINRLSAENNRLHMELDAALIDASRYRWLRKTQVELSMGHDTVAMLVANQSELDDAIKGEPHEPT